MVNVRASCTINHVHAKLVYVHGNNSTGNLVLLLRKLPTDILQTIFLLKNLTISLEISKLRPKTDFWQVINSKPETGPKL